MISIKKVAAVDIGSNAMRLLINDVVEDGNEKQYIKIGLVRVPIRLGTEVFTQGNISDESIDRLIHAMHAYEHLLKAHRVELFRACATSAMREAKNGAEVVKLVKEKTGLTIEIIDGKEEADIIYANHIEKLIDDSKAYLYVDVGGGSTEISIINNGGVIKSKSFKIGTLRILNDMINENMWHQMKNWLEEHTPYTGLDLIGSGGNINKVAKVSRKDLSHPITASYLNKYYKDLQKYSYEERIMKLDLKSDRADVIIPAMKIFTSVMKWTKSKKIFVPKMGLADGIIKQLY